MLSLLASLALILPVLDDKSAPPDPAKIQAAVSGLEKAFKPSGEAKERVEAIRAAAELPDAEIVKRIGKGLTDKDLEVQKAAIEALRWIHHPDALKELHAAAKNQKQYKEQPILLADLLKAIGQYGQASSIAVLTDEVWAVQEANVLRARILGLGQIRTKESVEALMELMRVAGTRKMQPMMEDFRLALAVLTGADQGSSQQLWNDWWNDNKNKLKVAEKAGELEKGLRVRWDSYWGKEGMMGTERTKKRGERGKDDPGTGSGEKPKGG